MCFALKHIAWGAFHLVALTRIKPQRARVANPYSGPQQRRIPRGCTLLGSFEQQPPHATPGETLLYI